MQPASVPARPSRRSAPRSRTSPPSDEIEPPAKSAVNLAPWHGEWRGQSHDPDNPPALFLIGRRGQPACWSPFANEAGNYNVAVTGKSGSGKSVLMQELVTGLIGAGGEAVVIDDGRSFTLQPAGSSTTRTWEASR